MGSAEDLREGREGFEFEFALGLAPLLDLEPSAGGGFPSGYLMCSFDFVPPHQFKTKI